MKIKFSGAVGAMVLGVLLPFKVVHASVVCETLLSRPERTFLALSRKAVAESLLTAEQIVALTRGELTVSPARSDLKAKDLPLARAFAELCAKLRGEFSPALRDELIRFAAAEDLAIAGKEEALRTTRTVLSTIPRTLTRVAHDPGSYQQSLFWYRDAENRPFVAVKDAESRILRTTEARPGAVNSVRREPLPPSEFESIKSLPAAFTVYNHRLKYLFARPRLRELVSYDVERDDAATAELPFYPSDLQPVTVGPDSFVVVSNRNSILVYQISDEFKLVRKIDRPVTSAISPAPILLSHEGRLFMVTAESGADVTLYAPLESDQPQQKWIMNAPIEWLAAHVNSQGKILAAAHLKGKQLVLVKEGQTELRRFDLSGDFNVSLGWKTSSTGESLLLVADSHTLSVLRSERPADPPQVLLRGKIVSARWNAAADGHDYVEATYLENGQNLFSILKVGETDFTIEAQLTNPPGSAQILKAPNGDWLYCSPFGHGVSVFNLTTKTPIFYNGQVTRAMSQVFEYRPGYFSIGTIGADGGIEIIELTQIYAPPG